jgi:hypothetical protein
MVAAIGPMAEPQQRRNAFPPFRSMNKKNFLSRSPGERTRRHSGRCAPSAIEPMAATAYKRARWPWHFKKGPLTDRHVSSLEEIPPGHRRNNFESIFHLSRTRIAVKVSAAFPRSLPQQ